MHVCECHYLAITSNLQKQFYKRLTPIMSKNKKITINVQGTDIVVFSQGEEDFISLTDMARAFGDDNLIYSWMRNRNTLEFIGIWEQMNNPDFKGGEFETFRTQAGLNSFHLTPRKWIEATGAIGIQSRAGRYGGTYAHRDLAFEFGSWLSPEFKLYQRIPTPQK